MINEEVRDQQPGNIEAPFSAFALGVELSRLGEAARDFPNLTNAAELLAKMSSGKLFAMGLKVLLDGLETHLDR